MYGYIYLTTNLLNGKIYIGQRKSNKFQGQRYLGSGRWFKRAVKKYGKENFKVELLEEVETEQLMDEREIYWISYYNSTNSEIGYNISEGGLSNRTLKGEHNGMYGKKHSEETKEIIRQKQIAHQKRFGNQGVTPEANKKRSETLKGHQVSDETRQKIREKNQSHLWVHNNEGNMFIHKDKLNDFLNKGFILGKEKFNIEDTGIRISITDGLEILSIRKNYANVYLHNGYWICTKNSMTKREQ